MKLVKEHINEKFEEESDPISDMGIGFYRNYNFSTYNEMIQFIIDNLVNILGTKNIPEDIMFLTSEVYMKREYFNKILDFVSKCVRINGYKTSISQHGADIITISLKQMGFKKIRI